MGMGRRTSRTQLLHPAGGRPGEQVSGLPLVRTSSPCTGCLHSLRAAVILEDMGYSKRVLGLSSWRKCRSPSLASSALGWAQDSWARRPDAEQICRQKVLWALVSPAGGRGAAARLTRAQPSWGQPCCRSLSPPSGLRASQPSPASVGPARALRRVQALPPASQGLPLRARAPHPTGALTPLGHGDDHVDLEHWSTGDKGNCTRILAGVSRSFRQAPPRPWADAGGPDAGRLALRAPGLPGPAPTSHQGPGFS